MIEGVIVSVGTGDQLHRTLPYNRRWYDRCVVVTCDELSAEVALANDCEVMWSTACYDRGDAFNKGCMINVGIASLSLDGWLLFTDADCFLPEPVDVGDLIVSNLYYMQRRHVPGTVVVPDGRVLDYHKRDPYGNNAPWGYFQLCNGPYMISRTGGRVPECFCSAGCVDHWLMRRFKRHVRLPGYVYHLWHGGLGSRWNGGERQGWTFIGQTPLRQWIGQWPLPCEVRRTDVLSLEVSKHYVTDVSFVEPKGHVFEYAIWRD